MSTTTDSLEKSLETDRSHLRETLNAIEGKMSPGRMIDEAMAYFDKGPKEFATLLGAQAKANPLPVLLTSVGLTWLIFGDRKTPPAGPETGTSGDDSQADDGSDDDYEAWAIHDRVTQFELDCSRLDDEPHEAWQARLGARRAAALGLERNSDEDDSAFHSRVSGAVDVVKSKGTAARDKLRERMKASKEAAGHLAHDGRAAVGNVATGVSDQGRAALAAASKLHESNPMATAAIGIAVGALLGALVPQSRREEEALGSVADQGLEAVATAARKAADVVSEKLPTGDPGESTRIRGTSG